MKKSLKISVIIAVYNEEKYIFRCIESVINQTYKNIEAIIVDDGSTDKTAEIVKKMMINDKRIKYFYKKNEGQGIARNYGINCAQGEYITFLDADDFLENNMFEKMIKSSDNGLVDSIITNWSLVYSDGSKISQDIGLLEKVYRNDEIKNIILPNIIATSFEEHRNINISGSVAKTLFKLSIIKNNKILFPSEKKYISEDVIFNVLFYQFAKSTYILDENLYNYFQKDGSYSHSYKVDLYEKVINMYFYLTDSLKKYNNEQINSHILKAFFDNVLLCIMQESIYQEGKLSNIKKICNEKEVINLCKQIKHKKMPIKRKIFCILLTHKLYIFLYLVCKLNNLGKK